MSTDARNLRQNLIAIRPLLEEEAHLRKYVYTSLGPEYWAFEDRLAEIASQPMFSVFYVVLFLVRVKDDKELLILRLAASGKYDSDIFRSSIVEKYSLMHSIPISNVICVNIVNTMGISGKVLINDKHITMKDVSKDKRLRLSDLKSDASIANTMTLFFGSATPAVKLFGIHVTKTAPRSNETSYKEISAVVQPGLSTDSINFACQCFIDHLGGGTSLAASSAAMPGATSPPSDVACLSFDVLTKKIVNVDSYQVQQQILSTFSSNLHHVLDSSTHRKKIRGIGIDAFSVLGKMLISNRFQDTDQVTFLIASLIDFENMAFLEGNVLPVVLHLLSKSVKTELPTGVSKAAARITTPSFRSSSVSTSDLPSEPHAEDISTDTIIDMDTSASAVFNTTPVQVVTSPEKIVNAYLELCEKIASSVDPQVFCRHLALNEHGVITQAIFLMPNTIYNTNRQGSIIVQQQASIHVDITLCLDGNYACSCGCEVHDLLSKQVYAPTGNTGNTPIANLFGATQVDAKIVCPQVHVLKIFLLKQPELDPICQIRQNGFRHKMASIFQTILSNTGKSEPVVTCVPLKKESTLFSIMYQVPGSSPVAILVRATHATHSMSDPDGRPVVAVHCDSAICPATAIKNRADETDCVCLTGKLCIHVRALQGTSNWRSHNEKILLEAANIESKKIGRLHLPPVEPNCNTATNAWKQTIVSVLSCQPIFIFSEWFLTNPLWNKFSARKSPALPHSSQYIRYEEERLKYSNLAALAKLLDKRFCSENIEAEAKSAGLSIDKETGCILVATERLVPNPPTLPCNCGSDCGWDLLPTSKYATIYTPHGPFLLQLYEYACQNKVHTRIFEGSDHSRHIVMVSSTQGFLQHLYSDIFRELFVDEIWTNPTAVHHALDRMYDGLYPQCRSFSNVEDFRRGFYGWMSLLDFSALPCWLENGSDGAREVPACCSTIGGDGTAWAPPSTFTAVFQTDIPKEVYSEVENHRRNDRALLPTPEKIDPGWADDIWDPTLYPVKDGLESAAHLLGRFRGALLRNPTFGSLAGINFQVDPSFFPVEVPDEADDLDADEIVGEKRKDPDRASKQQEKQKEKYAVAREVWRIDFQLCISYCYVHHPLLVPFLTMCLEEKNIDGTALSNESLHAIGCLTLQLGTAASSHSFFPGKQLELAIDFVRLCRSKDTDITTTSKISTFIVSLPYWFPDLNLLLYPFRLGTSPIPEAFVDFLDFLVIRATDVHKMWEGKKFPDALFTLNASGPSASADNFCRPHDPIRVCIRNLFLPQPQTQSSPPPFFFFFRIFLSNLNPIPAHFFKKRN